MFHVGYFLANTQIEYYFTNKWNNFNSFTSRDECDGAFEAEWYDNFAASEPIWASQSKCGSTYESE